MAMTENTAKVLNYLKGLNGADVTANDVASALGLTGRQINGIFTGGIQRKGLGIREEAKVELQDGTTASIKFLKLTDAGLACDPSAEA